MSNSFVIFCVCTHAETDEVCRSPHAVRVLTQGPTKCVGRLMRLRLQQQHTFKGESGAFCTAEFLSTPT